MEYISAIFWYATWPILIFIAYKFVLMNLTHHSNMERLRELEEKCANESK